MGSPPSGEPRGRGAHGAPGGGAGSGAGGGGSGAGGGSAGTTAGTAGSGDGRRRERDRVLRGCKTVEYQGQTCPALGPPERPWVILRRIDHGGMGVVYYGRHAVLDSPVAIKVLPADHEDRQPMLGERFVQEARIAAQVQSANLVRVFDVDRDPETELRFFVMEYIHGVTAGRWTAGLPGGRASERDALEVVIAATRGLEAVHRARVLSAPRGAVHRDVKPNNIFIPFDGAERPDLPASKLGDLGLSCPDGSDHSMTGDVTAMGTPGYASPEQLVEVSRAQKPSDVFSMGATLYALLTGEAPFAHKDRGQRIADTCAGRYRPLPEQRPDASRAVCDLVERCLRLAPEERPADATALLERLADCRRRLGRGRARTDDSTTRDVAAAVEAAREGRIAVAGGPPRGSVVLRREADGATSDAALDADGSLLLRVVPGSYRIVVSDPAHEEWSSLVAVGPGADAQVRVERRARPALIEVGSDPEGADVWLGDRKLGTTPLRACAVAPGDHRLVLRRPGSVDETVAVSAAPGATCRVGPVTLAALPVFDAPGLPPDAVVELDGRPVADGDAVQPGRYVCLARRRGFEPQRLELVFAPGARVRPDFAPWRRESAPLLDDLADWDRASPAERESAARGVERRLRGFVHCGLASFASGGVTHEIACFRHEPTGIEFALLPGGRAVVGSPLDEEGHRPDERLRTVSLAPFLCARTSVAASVWRGVMDAEPPRGAHPGAPVAGVTWEEAGEFCRRAGFELPSEWEREYAARAGTTSRFSFGDGADDVGRHAWWRGNAGGRVRDAGRLPANAFGLFDVHGNVADWCADAYREDPDSEDAARAPTDAPRYRTFRGGTCRDDVAALRSAARGAAPAWLRGHAVGVRPIVRITADPRRVAAAPATAPATATAAIGAAPAPEAPIAPAAERPDAVPVPETAVAPEVADILRWRAATSAERSRAALAVARLAPGFSFRGLQAFASGGAQHEVAVFLHDATGLEFCLIPAGHAVLGSPQGERGRFPDEAKRSADVPPYLLARTAVTQAAWSRVVATNPSSFHGPDRPVECVTWDEAVAFCGRTGLELPSEAQWEFACRAGTTTRFSFGDDEADLDAHAWYEGNSGHTSRPVGAKAPNAFGLFDVHGNVWEWCRDAAAPRASDGARPESEHGARRVVRGGGWAASSEYLRSAVRLAFAPAKRMGTVGFRPSFTIAPRGGAS